MYQLVCPDLSKETTSAACSGAASQMEASGMNLDGTLFCRMDLKKMKMKTITEKHKLKK